MKRWLVWFGGSALLAAAAVDTLFVLGRHFGLPLHGAIELVEAAVLLSGSTALVMSSLAGNHARVHVVLDRLPAAHQNVAQRAGDVLTALFFAGLLAGSLWIAADLWSAHEQTELVGVPWRWLRLVLNLCLGAALLLTLRRALRKQP
ncbi:MAG: TRAP transporter small permease subunit [Sphingomonadales bacterium]|nr:TRAP transporter small permease subunit [Sphingomonadales bacterium]